VKALTADLDSFAADCRELALRLKSLDPLERFHGDCLGVLNDCFARWEEEFTLMTKTATLRTGVDSVHLDIPLAGKLGELLTTLRAMQGDVSGHGASSVDD
jgi:hypothetical protein